jgi:hypothetical protein
MMRGNRSNDPMTCFSQAAAELKQEGTPLNLGALQQAYKAKKKPERVDMRKRDQTFLSEVGSTDKVAATLNEDDAAEMIRRVREGRKNNVKAKQG